MGNNLTYESNFDHFYLNQSSVSFFKDNPHINKAKNVEKLKKRCLSDLVLDLNPILGFDTQLCLVEQKNELDTLRHVFYETNSSCIS